MKTIIIITVLTLTAIAGIARVSSLFPGWSQLESESSDIGVAVARGPSTPVPGEYIENATRSDSEITILSVLKGTNGAVATRLQTDHELKRGEAYLIFGSIDNGTYKAYEDYRVIPLGAKFRKEMIDGKPLHEQIQTLLRRAVENLNEEMARNQSEKNRIEAGLIR